MIEFLIALPFIIISFVLLWKFFTKETNVVVQNNNVVGGDLCAGDLNVVTLRGAKVIPDLSHTILKVTRADRATESFVLVLAKERPDQITVKD